MTEKLMKILFAERGAIDGDLYSLMKSEDGGENWKFHGGCVLCRAAGSPEQPADYMHRFMVDELLKLTREGYVLITEG